MEKKRFLLPSLSWVWVHSIWYFSGTRILEAYPSVRAFGGSNSIQLQCASSKLDLVAYVRIVQSFIRWFLLDHGYNPCVSVAWELVARIIHFPNCVRIKWQFCQDFSRITQMPICPKCASAIVYPHIYKKRLLRLVVSITKHIHTHKTHTVWLTPNQQYATEHL